jgi:metal-responsive CopG/Arc/MetJ family transcriptional regulator
METVTISLPSVIIEQLDEERGDVSRSRYVARIIERRHELKEQPIVGGRKRRRA